jgi:hypothetical protein
MRYSVHRVDVNRETMRETLGQFLNGLSGEIVAVLPDVRPTFQSWERPPESPVQDRAGGDAYPQWREGSEGARTRGRPVLKPKMGITDLQVPKSGHRAVPVLRLEGEFRRFPKMFDWQDIC